MENTKPNIFAEALEKGLVELNLEDMDKVSGGVMTSSDKATLKKYLKMAKDENMSMEDVLSLIPTFFPLYTSQYPNVTIDDVKKYIKKVYPTL